MGDPRTRPAIEGSCLCGTARIGLTRVPRTMTQCNCSVCRRYGVLWAYYRRKDVAIVAPRGGLERYAVRPKGLRFVRCAGCGCVTSWEPPERGPDQRMGINARLLDPALVANVDVKILDGDQTWRVLERYRRPAMFQSPKRR